MQKLPKYGRYMTSLIAVYLNRYYLKLGPKTYKPLQISKPNAQDLTKAYRDLEYV